MTMSLTRLAVDPRVPTQPPAGIRAKLARRLTEHVARTVPVDIRLPDGSLLGSPRTGRCGSRPSLDLVAPEAFFDRLGQEPKLGFAEGYLAGEWRTSAGTDLADALVPFAERVTTMLPPGVARLRRLIDRPIPATQRNSVAGSRGNIRAHYDLSNDLFAAFLDETLTYSSALFDQAGPWHEQSLGSAQLRKVRRILDQARVGAGSRVLEIGTGWGTLAIEAARRGAQVTTVTLSIEQAALAQRRVEAAGVADRVDIRLEDYREVSGTYDAVVSVEMIEAVGEEFWPTYFRVLDDRLAPGGVAAIQSILIGHDRYLATRNSYSWIQKHIFPGGLLPSLRAIDVTATRHTELRVTDVHAFGLHYAETLRRWRAAFTEQWPRIAEWGFDETFRRMWELYLAYSEAGFRAGYLDVAQLRLERAGS